MKANFIANKAFIYTHIFASAVALMLGPFQFSTALRRRFTRLHRWSGRAYLGIGVLFGGLCALYMSAHAFGGPAAKLGFAGLAVCWLYTGLQAFLAIRRGSVDEHRKWMVRNFSLTFAAVTLRIYIPASIMAGIPFEVAVSGHCLGFLDSQTFSWPGTGFNRPQACLQAGRRRAPALSCVIFQQWLAELRPAVAPLPLDGHLPVGLFATPRSRKLHQVPRLEWQVRCVSHTLAKIAQLPCSGIPAFKSAPVSRA